MGAGIVRVGLVFVVVLGAIVALVGIGIGAS